MPKARPKLLMRVNEVSFRRFRVAIFRKFRIMAVTTGLMNFVGFNERVSHDKQVWASFAQGY